jgi:hypothetical protein
MSTQLPTWILLDCQRDIAGIGCYNGEPVDPYLIELAKQAYHLLTATPQYNALDYLAGTSQIPDCDISWIRKEWGVENDWEDGSTFDSVVEGFELDFQEMYIALAERLAAIAPSKDAMALMANYRLSDIVDGGRAVVLEKIRTHPPLEINHGKTTKSSNC